MTTTEQNKATVEQNKATVEQNKTVVRDFIDALFTRGIPTLSMINSPTIS